MRELIALLMAVLGTARAAAVYGDEYDAASGNFGLENELAYERRENEAIARLYENVLDILQVLYYAIYIYYSALVRGKMLLCICV